MPLPTTEICKRVGAATSRLVILHPDPPHKLLSFGTGFAISPKGVILTARHVVSDGNQFYKGPIHGIANSSGAIQMYVPITAADLRLDTNTRETKPLPIDMALLQPFPPLPQECAYLPLREAILEVGEEVIVAGYAKDITYPFFIQEKLDTRTFEGMDMKAKFKQAYGLRQLLFKKTIVGVTWRLTIGSKESLKKPMLAAHYVFGTDMIEGSSGGPLVDMEGGVAGVISRKGTLEFDGYDIPTSNGKALDRLPTGSGTALSHHLITDLFPSLSFPMIPDGLVQMINDASKKPPAGHTPS